MVTKTGYTLQERLARHRRRNKRKNRYNQARKISLLVGCDYEGTNAELKGCSKDVKDMDRLLLHEKFSNILLCDDTERKHLKSRNAPTKEHILNRLTGICKSSAGNSKLVFHYSGHGYYDRDFDKRKIFGHALDSESDGKDELIIATDMKAIRDDEINHILCTIGKNVRALLVIDACHSGTMADLKYVLKDGERIVNNAHDGCVADIISISGCKDDQTSADAFLYKSFRGAMTTAFIHAFSTTDGGNVSVAEFVDIMKSWLVNNHFEQIPQLCFTQPYAYRKAMKFYF